MLNSKNKKLPYIICFGILIPLIGLVSSFFFQSNSIYNELTLPTFAPPVFVYVIAWTFLYFILGVFIANAFYYKEKRVIALFIIHLIFNLSWSFIFFKFGLYFIAYIVLMLIIVSCLMLFKISQHSYRILLIPYLLWLTFAAYLNFMIVILNP